MNKKIMKAVYLFLISTAIALVGVWIINDWKIALGVFIMLWANNIGMHNHE